MSTGSGSPNSPAGWYPTGGGQQRYWDGFQWTEHVAPAPGQPVVAAPFRPSHDFPDDITSDDRTSAILVHVLGLLTGLFGVLILWLVKRDDSSFVDAHGKAAMNFHLSLIIYWFVSFIAALVLIGFLMMLVLLVLQVLFPILAAVAANRGERHTYPLTIPFIK